MSEQQKLTTRQDNYWLQTGRHGKNLRSLAQERLSLFVKLHPVQKVVIAGSSLSENLCAVLQHSTSSDNVDGGSRSCTAPHTCKA